MNRRLPDLEPSTTTACRRARIDGDKLVSVLHDFQQRWNREFRRAHEDNSHRLSSTSKSQIIETSFCPKFRAQEKNFLGADAELKRLSVNEANSGLLLRHRRL